MGLVAYNTTLPAVDSALITAASDTLLAGMVAVNGSGTDRTISLAVHRGNGQAEPLASSLTVPASSAVVPVDMEKMALGEVLLRTGDVLRGSVSAGTSVTLLAWQ